MSSFQAMFEESRGQPIRYQGQDPVMVDYFPMQGNSRLAVEFESCAAEWRQGVALVADCALQMAGRILGKKLVLWQHTAPRVVLLELAGNADLIEVKNVWDVGDGVVHSWHNGAAMIVEELVQGRRYRCNDGFPDDDFDDLVFRIDRRD